MTTERGPQDEDAALDAALRDLPVPALPADLRLRLQAIPERENVRRFPLRVLRAPALGWAAAAVLGLFVGARSLESEATDAGDVAVVEAGSDDGMAADAARSAEDETLELAVGSFADFEEEP
jgi:hypothetical protein